MLETGVCRQNPTRSDSTASAHIHSAAEIKKKKKGQEKQSEKEFWALSEVSWWNFMKNIGIKRYMEVFT